MNRTNEIFLTFFFSGKAKKAPGTFGSAAALIFWFILSKCFSLAEISLLNQNIFWGIFLTISFIYGCIASPIYAKQFGEIDHSSIVLDEVVGQIFALQATFTLFDATYFRDVMVFIPHLLGCFVLFRFFDIVKPSIIGYCDRHFKSGFGVMFDDLLSGIVSAAIMAFFITF